jgi:peptidoglycan/LPS O-acetylase OafA/YrhL
VRLESGRVFGLDVMRASAITLVLFNHTALFFSAHRLFFGAGLLAGYFGVELFFVLSGFLIGGILLRTLEVAGAGANLSNFWRRRWLRTLPNYFLFLFVNLALAVWLLGGAPSLLPYFFFFQNITARPQPFFVESWSLAVEEWFYILVPVLFLIANKISPRSFRASSLTIVCAGILAVALARTIYVIATHPVWLTDVRMIVVYRLDACMFGVLAAWVKHYHPKVWQRTPRFLFSTGLAVLGMIAALPFVLPGDSLVLHTAGFPLTSLGAALLLPMLDRWRAAGGPSAVAIVKISIWSYSLYLVNLPLHAVLNRLYPHASPFLLAGAFLVFSTTIAAFVYRLYEKPIMDLRERILLRRINLDLNDTAPLLVKN